MKAPRGPSPGPLEDQGQLGWGNPILETAMPMHSSHRKRACKMLCAGGQGTHDP